MTDNEIKATTTEDLKATCQNYPTGPDAISCAHELEIRIGKNEYSDAVFTRSFTTFTTGKHEASSDSQMEMVVKVGRTGFSWALYAPGGKTPLRSGSHAGLNDVDALEMKTIGTLVEVELCRLFALRSPR